VKPSCSNRRNHALTLTEVLVVVVVLVVLVAMILPALNAAKHPSRRPVCVSNLKQIGFAFRVWEEDHSGKNPMQVSVTNWGAMELALTGDVAGIFRTMSIRLPSPKVLVCPEDTGRIAATNFATDFNNSKISYFVSVEAIDTRPQMFLSGDDNFAIGGVPVKSGLLELSTNAPISWTGARHVVSYKPHFWTPTQNKFVGCIGFADSSVSWQVTQNGLQQAFQQTGVATNRLAIP
jgi:competence protein ComGC